MATRIYIDRARVASNKLPGAVQLPVVKVKADGKPNVWAREVIINGPSRVRYAVHGGLVDASAWVETDAEVELVP